MQVVIIGAGPTGLLLGQALARRGHEVLAVERDSGPPTSGPWVRRGVMQFHHAHGLRLHVGTILEAEWPEAYQSWLTLGAEPATFDVPGVGPVVGGHRSRRETLERALRSSAENVPGFVVRQGHVDDVIGSAGQVRGVIVDGTPLSADLVVDASGRAGHATDSVRAGASVGGLCGMAYIDRIYRRHEGTDLGPMTNPVFWQGDFQGFQAMVFPYDHRYFSVLVVRPTADAAMKELRHAAAFEAACRTVPGLDEWTDPRRAAPATDVLPGGPLRNTYRPQTGPDGGYVRGLVGVGDSVATTTPIYGRGLPMAFMQVHRLLQILDGGADPTRVGEPFGAWCDANMLPWVIDHIGTDTDLVRRWQGGDVDLGQRLPSDLIVAAAQVDPTIMDDAMGYLGMSALPSSLDPVEPRARAVYETGWRPPFSPGPTRNELVSIIRAAVRTDLV